MEARALLSSSQMSRRHGALQNALAVTTYLNRLVQPCQASGIDISAAVQFESAAVLWDQGEMAASINMLQDLKANVDGGKQAVHVGKPELLARLVGNYSVSIDIVAAHRMIGASNIGSEAGEAWGDHQPVSGSGYQGATWCHRGHRGRASLPRVRLLLRSAAPESGQPGGL